MNPLAGKSILLGITGGIAAYKVPELIRTLKRKDARVKVVMTENAKRFVSPLVISTLSDGLIPSLWEGSITHISLAEEASLLCIVPADYNIIGKAASGIADDLLSTVISAFDGEILFFPSMNYRMYNNPILQKNIDLLRDSGGTVIEPDTGELAYEGTGKGRLPAASRIVLEIEKALTPDLLKGSYCLITGGGTHEKIDPVRYITNRSSGRMAYSLAKCCYMANGKPELIMGITSSKDDENLPYNLIRVENAREMQEEILKRWDRVDYLFMSAAVSDFTCTSSAKKIKKKEKSDLKLKKNLDILLNLKNKKKEQFVVGFALESDNLLSYAKKKMKEKEVDLMVANDISSIGSDFTSGFLIFPGGEEPFKCRKDELSWKILKRISSKKS